MLKIEYEAARCLLCENAACTKACGKGYDPSRMLRAIRFDNTDTASLFVDKSICQSCDGSCEKACVHYDLPLRIKEVIDKLPDRKEIPDVDLSIDFLGVHCENPFFLSSSIVAGNYEMCAAAFDAGWSGAVYKTIGFIKPKEVSPRFDAIGKEGTPFIGFKNLEQISDHDLHENLDILKRLKRNYPNKIVVASIMGQTDEEWTELSRLVTEAGVDIIECNFSCPHMSGKGLGSDVGQNPDLVEKYTRLVKKCTNLPVLAKMTPNTGNMEIPAMAAVKGGADGIAAINTIKSITGLDLKCVIPKMDVAGKSSVSGYSGKAVKPIALRFIHDMKKYEGLKNIPISGMGGIETWHDAAEFIALGCENIQVTTSVMQYGYRIIDDLISGLARFMTDNGYKHVSDIVGIALDSMVSSENLDRDSVVYPVFDRKTCVGCGRCLVSCRDAGHQAIRMDEAVNKPALKSKNCVGCHLCSLVCPLGCIGVSKRVYK